MKSNFSNVSKRSVDHVLISFYYNFRTMQSEFCIFKVNQNNVISYDNFLPIIFLWYL